MSEFVHLSCLSDRSIGTGLIKPSQLVEHYASCGAKAACITDYGNMSAAIQLHKHCRSHSIKPIYGMVVNLVEDKSLKKQGHHNLCLLAKDISGLRSLTKIATVGAMYFYYVPRIDLDTLRQYSEGLIALTGGVKGVAAKQLFTSADADLQPLLDTMRPIYGDSLYLEIQDAPTDSQKRLNEEIVAFASRSGVGVVATGMPHYLLPEDSDLHKSLYTARNYRSGAAGYPLKGAGHVKSYTEMVDSLSSLHQGDNLAPYLSAIDHADYIIDLIEDFDLRDGVKIPRYAG